MEKQKRMIIELDPENYEAIRLIAFKNNTKIKRVANHLIKEKLKEVNQNGE